MRVIEIKKVQPKAEPSLVVDTVTFFATVAVGIACYIVVAAAF